MTVRLVIIGAGYAGIGLGIALKRAGIDAFTILEAASRVGGTWRDNTYPGCSCDSPAFQYCYSFEQKTDWTQRWVSHAEILRYLEHCVRKYHLTSHIRCGVTVASATFDADAQLWRVTTDAGEEYTGEVLVSAVGQLTTPRIPDLPHLDTFAGRRFHSARWDHGTDLAGRRVAVVGTAASAIQLIPHVARVATRVSVLQRSPNWLLPRGNRPFTATEQARFESHPQWRRLYRWWQWMRHESRFPVFRAQRWLSRPLAAMAQAHMRRIIRSPELQQRLQPDFPIGAKRILISDDYYESLNRANVELITQPIADIEPHGIRLANGSRIDADVIVFATGFRAAEFLRHIDIRGMEGLSLQDQWRGGAQAYLGISVSGFPNFFLMYGPNTNLGHNSIVFMIECQARYIVDAVRTLDRHGLRTVDVRPDVQARFDQRQQARLARTVWALAPNSWYTHSSGRITNNWAGTTIEYWWRTRRFDLARYHATHQ